jgi:hypothetical protein
VCGPGGVRKTRCAGDCCWLCNSSGRSCLPGLPAQYAFVRTQPHRDIMASLRPTMRSSTSTFWNVPAEQLPLTWDHAKRRLAEQARADATSADHITPGMITIHSSRRT